MIEPGSRLEWVPRPLAGLAIAAVGVAVVVHASVGFRGAYLTYGSGVWLSLARDLSDGVLYRDLVSDLGFGGTRYFPLFFSAIALVHTLGAPLVTAGWIVGSLAVVLLFSGASRLATAAGAPRMTALLFGAAVTAPYFALQTIFEIRADVLSAALNLWGVALILPAFRRVDTAGQWAPRTAQVCFLLAIATKVTAIGIPLGMVLAAVLTRRMRLAMRIGLQLAAQVAIFLALVQWLSGGRALRVWAACLFGGSDAAGTLTALASGGFMTGLVNSNLILAVGAFALVTLAAAFAAPASDSPVEADVSALVPTSLWAAASGTLALNLSSPGTVPSNQVPEWIAFSLLLPVFLAAKQIAVRRALTAAVALLSLWMGGQNLLRSAERRGVMEDGVRHREAIISRLTAFPAPILSESALWPILAHREVVMPDPFAARIVFRARPELEGRLIQEIAQRKYSAILLEFDPSSPEGQRMYGFAHFSKPVVSAITSHYRLQEPGLTGVFVFVPAQTRPAVDTSGRY